MIWWWILVEVFFVAFFVYGYVIYRRQVKAHEAEDREKNSNRPGDN